MLKRIQTLALSDNLARAGMRNILFRVLGVGLSFLFMKMVTFMCGAEGWGQYTLAYTVALTAVSIGRLGVDTVLVKTLGQGHALGQYHRLQSAFKQSTWAVIGVSLALAIVVWFAAPFLAQGLGKPQLDNYIRIAALWIPFWAPLFLFTECLRGLGQNNAYQLLQTIVPFGIGVVLLAPFVSGVLPAFTPDPALVAYGVGLFICSLIAFLYVNNTLGRLRGKVARSRFPIRILRRMALPILSTYLLVVGLSMTDVLLLGYLAPNVADTGVYAVALRISFLMLIPLQALGSVSASDIAGLHASAKHSQLTQKLRHTGRLVRMATTPLWLAVCVGSPFLMGFFGQGFEAGWPILIVLATNQFINALCGPIDVLLQMTGRERTYRNLLAFGLLLNAAANFILIPIYGIWGAAIAHSIALISWNLLGVWRIYKHYGIWLLRIW